MKRRHFEELRPVCPSCRAPLRLAREIRASSDEILEGTIECGSCLHEYPILDGIPLLVRDLRRLVSDQILAILMREDLSETMLGLLGECCGPSSALDVSRQHLSTYVASHYESKALAEILERARNIDAPLVDVGCSVGGGTFALAARTPGLVLGIDLNVSMLRVARRVLREGRVRYAKRRVGLVYEERDLAVPLRNPENVDFWCADALALPLPERSCGFAASVNLLDCTGSPLDHLRSLRDVLRVGGRALIATPFDWAPSATPVEAWVGGHSARGTWASEEVLRALLGGKHPAALPDFRLVSEERGIEWPLRLHDRSTMKYSVDIFTAERA